MELTALRQLLAVCETMNMTAAAKRLGVSQPALSAAVKKLEAEFGAALFLRRSGGLQLTAAGVAAEREARKVVAAADGMRRIMAVYADGREPLRIGFCDPGPLWFTMPRFCLLEAGAASAGDAAGGEPLPKPNARVYEEKSLQEDARRLLEDEFDLLVSSWPLGELSSDEGGAADADEALAGRRRAAQVVRSERFLSDRLLLSLPPGADADLGPDWRPGAPVELARVRRLSVLFFEIAGSFGRRAVEAVQSLPAFGRGLEWEAVGDYFLFQEMLRRSGRATITTALVRHYRYDGPERIEIPIVDPWASIEYFANVLPAKRARAAAFLDFVRETAKRSGLTGEGWAQCENNEQIE